MRYTTWNPQSGMPVLGINARDGPVTPVFAEIALVPASLKTRISPYLVITEHPNAAASPATPCD